VNFDDLDAALRRAPSDDGRLRITVDVGQPLAGHGWQLDHRAHLLTLTVGARHVVSITPTPHEEPTERGAVVMDRQGRVWVRVDTDAEPWMHTPDGAGMWAAWTDLDDPQPVQRAEP
jgi:hypothetical protein